MKVRKLYYFLALFFWLALLTGGGYFLLSPFVVKPYAAVCPQHPQQIYSRSCLDNLYALYHKELSHLQQGQLYMFSLSSKPLAELIKKKLKTNELEVVYDVKYGQLFKKMPQATPYKKSSMMHMKLLTTDKGHCYIGSANFSPSSLKKDQNLVLGLFNPSLVNFIHQHSLNPQLKSYKDSQLELYLLPKNLEALECLKQSIQESQKTLKVAMYTFTHQALAQELISAKKRGVKVEVILDRKQAKSYSLPVIQSLEQGGIHPQYIGFGEVNHHKFVLIDEKNLCMGSANWTQGAFKKNKEVLVRLTLNPRNQKKMQQVWKALRHLARG